MTKLIVFSIVILLSLKVSGENNQKDLTTTRQEITHNPVEISFSSEYISSNRKILCQEYWDITDIIKSHKTFVNGKLEGTLSDYYLDGSLHVLEHYLNGKLHGIRRLYYENGGELRVLENYLNGKLHGAKNVYHRNGKIYVYQEYTNGVQTGMEKINDMNGVTVETNFYDKGMKKEKVNPYLLSWDSIKNKIHFYWNSVRNEIYNRLFDSSKESTI